MGGKDQLGKLLICAVCPETNEKPHKSSKLVMIGLFCTVLDSAGRIKMCLGRTIWRIFLFSRENKMIA